MLRKGMRQRHKLIRLMKYRIPRSQVLKWICLQRTFKQAKISAAKSHSTELELMQDGKRSHKQNMLNYFIAKNLPKIVSLMNRDAIQLSDSYKIATETVADLKKRYGRLKSMRNISQVVKQKETTQKPKATFKKRKSIMLLFGETQMNQVIFEADDESDYTSVQ